MLASTAVAGSLFAAAAGGQGADAVPQPSRGAGTGGTDPGPRNVTRDRQNPDLLDPPSTDSGTLPNLRFSYADAHTRQTSGGWTRQVTARELGVSQDIAGVNMRLNAGSIRELHWHQNNNEWQYYLEGQGRMGVFAADGQARTYDFMAGGVGYVPFAMDRCIENTGTTPLRFLEMFKSDRCANFSLNQWMALTPTQLLESHLRLDKQVMDALQTKQSPVVPA